jgi:hypothetical protein
VASAPGGYTASWSTFDNATGATRPLADTRSRTASLDAPRNLPADPGSFITVTITEDGAAPAAPPLRAWFHRDERGWKLVGLERLPDGPSPAKADAAKETARR